VPAAATARPRVFAAVALTTTLLLLAGCGSDQVSLTSPTPNAADRAACERLVGALPDSIDDQERRPIEPADALGAAYGDPPIVLLCGGEMPGDFDQFSPCVEVDGVGWYVPVDQMGDQPSEVTMTTIGYRPVVQVTVPEAYWRQGAPNAQVDLAEAIRSTLTRESRCR
jgi:Protein of unknown function (DUF3515)